MQEELEWLARLRDGEGEALHPLMLRYGDDIMRTAYWLVRDRHLAEEISQDVFLAAYRKVRQFRGEGSLRGWLLQITVNAARAHLRRASWKRRFMLKAEETEVAESDPGIEGAADRDFLRGHVGALPYKYREVVVLHYYRDLSVRDIADMLGERENTVKSKLLRGRALLRDRLTEGGWGHGEA